MINLTERVRAGHARERAKATDRRTKCVEERAVYTMLVKPDAEVLSVTRLGEVRTMKPIKSGTDLHLVLTEGDKVDIGVPIRHMGRNVLR